MGTHLWSLKSNLQITLTLTGKKILPKMAAQFGSKPDLTKLNNFLLDKAYIQGWEVSAEDVAVFKALSSAPNAEFINALRWWNHIKSYESEFGNFKAAAPAADDDDDSVDLFGSDSEDDEAAEKLKAERVAAYNAKRRPKKQLKVRQSLNPQSPLMLNLGTMKPISKKSKKCTEISKWKVSSGDQPSLNLSGMVS